MNILRLVLISGVLTFVSSVLAQGPPPTPAAPQTVSSTSAIATAAEPGRRLVVTGQVFAPDGVTPAAGVIIYAYQTDSTGEYHNNAEGVARLHGWARTDTNGSFEFRTIVPGPYPKLAIAAHVHFHAYGGGYPLQWTEELKFSGDPSLTAREIGESKALGVFANILPLYPESDGALHCRIRLRLSKETNYPAAYRNDPRTR